MQQHEGQVTIKSIAAALGVSYSTVSKALNGDPRISETTRQRVEDKAREMHYSRNFFAETLRRSDSRIVVILLNDLDVPAYSEMISVISADLAAYGYTTIISDTQFDPESERNVLEGVLRWRPSAVIYSPAYLKEENLHLLEPYLSRTLFLGCTGGREDLNAVAVDHRQAGYLSARHMLERGSLGNLILCGSRGYQSADLFMTGVQDAYGEFGLTADPGWVVRFKPDTDTSCRRFLEFRRAKGSAVTGAICFCDHIALGVYKACRELGLSIPGDVSVIGYDDTDPDAFIMPPLTSVHIPRDLIARHSSRFVTGRLIEGNTDHFSVFLDPYLAVRDSVRPLTDH